MVSGSKEGKTPALADVFSEFEEIADTNNLTGLDKDGQGGPFAWLDVLTNSIAPRKSVELVLCARVAVVIVFDWHWAGPGLVSKTQVSNMLKDSDKWPQRVQSEKNLEALLSCSLEDIEAILFVDAKEKLREKQMVQRRNRQHSLLD